MNVKTCKVLSVKPVPEDELPHYVYDVTVANNHNLFANGMLASNCLIGNTLVTLSDNTTKTIQEIVEGKLTGPVISYNTETNRFESNEIYGWRKISSKEKNKKTLRLTFELEDGTEQIIECTEDHKIWVESLNEYVPAKDLTKEMNFVAYKED